MIQEKLGGCHFILASASPRRRYLLEGLGLDFEVLVREVDETYPPNLAGEQIALYLCELKANAFDMRELPPQTVLITADTIVLLGDEVLGKPADAEEAMEMLGRLSGNTHEVITAVCLKSADKVTMFSDSSLVKFKELSREEINWYVRHCLPFDKAGAYGVQEWIGYVAIERIEGSFYNVMGMPTLKLYQALLEF